MCGKIICKVCSEQRIMMNECTGESPPESFTAGESSLHRACFRCYTHAYIQALTTRKASCANLEEFHSDDDKTNGSLGNARELSMNSDDGNLPSDAVGDEDPPSPASDTVDWPVISIAMDTKFKLCNNLSPDLSTLLYVKCRYLRVIRWEGRADEGRIMLSLEWPNR